MKILSLTEPQKNEVKLQREKLTAALNMVVNFNQALNKLLKQQETLTAEIATLESASPDDKMAISTLGEKRTQLELVERRITECPPVDSESEHELMLLLHEATKQITRILLPTYEKYLADISALLRPFSIDDGWAKGIAQKTNAAVSLAQAISRDYGRYGGAISNAKEVLNRYGQIQDGEFVWEFNPNLS